MISMLLSSRMIFLQFFTTLTLDSRPLNENIYYSIEYILYHHNHQPILCFDQIDRLNDQLDAGQKPTFKNNEHLYLAQNYEL